jgi:NAD(P)-dependent dehydrogenase (short-subunit alcohol dehydrogenase family)
MMLSRSAVRRLQVVSSSLRRLGPRTMTTATPGGDGANFGHEGKLVIVTGGANGIGRAVCLEFARCGANVLCADYDGAAGEETVAEAAGLSGSVKFMEADMTDAAVPAKIVAAAQEWQGGTPVGCLVNNVGIQEDNGTPVHLLEEAVWDKVMDVNIKSYFLMAKYSLPSMIEAQSGVIINMASVQGHQSQVGIPAYASSKGAILSLTRQMAMDYSNSGIRSVSISPGTILTREKEEEKHKHKHPPSPSPSQLAARIPILEDRPELWDSFALPSYSLLSQRLP